MESLPRLAGRLLRGEPSLDGIPADAQLRLLEFLRLNKVLLFEADPENPRGASLLCYTALQTPALADRIEAQRDSCDAQRRAFLAAQEVLVASGSPPLLFKTTGPYPYASSNVDALVPAGAFEPAAEALLQAGYHEMAHYWEPNKRLFHRFAAERCELKLHLHERVSWLVLSFIDADEVWKNAGSSTDPLIRHPARERVVAALLAHTVYESNQVNLGDVWKIRQAVAHERFSWEEVHRLASLRSWLPGLALACEWYARAERAAFEDSLIERATGAMDLPAVTRDHGDAVQASLDAGRWPIRVKKGVTKHYFFRKLLRDDRQGARKKLWDLAGVAIQVSVGRLGLRRRPASLICICGIDGSGKSTHAGALIEALRELEVPCRQVWMRGGYSPVMEGLKRILRRSGRVPGIADRSAKSRVYRGRLTGRLWSWLVTAEQTLQAFFQARVALWRGRTLVTDRYMADTLADMAEKTGDAAFARRLSVRLMRRVAPRPNLLVLLDLPGAVAFARKPDDFDEQVLESRRQTYLSILQGDPDCIVLDGMRDLDELKRETVDRALAVVLGRFKAANRLNRQRRDAWNRDIA
jgi:thymidylate kinase